MSIRLLIADDHDLVREGLRQIFERSGVEVVGEAGSAAEVLERAVDVQVEVLLLDIGWISDDESTSSDTGLDLLEQIHALRPALPILMYSAQDGTTYLELCHCLGASGYLVKGIDDVLLVTAVHALYSGQQIWSEAAQRGALRQRIND
jgi:DNA-binding NarL/FixJ family response regulator